jgi:energy-coupling factor transporter ATP-binding protein EcfA2
VKLESLTIRKFRGIKDLTIPFEGKSWVIHGRNGSGKSGVIDAIEFGLSGTIGRLTGEGRGGITVKEHGPHVDSKDNPKDAEVILGLSIEDNQTFKIVRNCSVPTKFKIEPSTENAKSLSQTGNEIVLSRREILKFILTEPGKRSKEVQALLKIDKLEEIRSALQTLANKVERNFDAEKQEFGRVKIKLKEWLGLEELNKEDVLIVVNKHRSILQLNTLTELSDETQLNEGIKKTEVQSQFLNKTELSKIVDAIKGSIFDSLGAFAKDSKKYLELIGNLAGKDKELKNLSSLGFYESGLKLIASDECPFCEETWKQDELREIVEQKVKDLSGINGIKKEISDQALKIKGHWKALKSEIDSYEDKTKKEAALESEDLKEIKNKLDALLSNQSQEHDAFKNDISNMTSFGLLFDKEKMIQNFTDLENKIKSLPEKSSEEKSKEFLIICQERMDNYKASKRKYEYQNKKLKLAQEMLEKFNAVSEGYLNNLYKEIEHDFSRFYQIVNHDDEAAFAGSLLADKGALDFKVAFYDRGQYPPAAYHSEGHQDGMGLCLYLALMKKILGDKFTLAVLDDVLMSIDEEHKKSFCKLLKQEFPKTQFVITTHDKYWQKQLITEGLISHSTALHFKNWSVDTGPCVWNEKDSWEEIDALINEDNIPSASHTLRRFLEYLMDEISVRLSASIPRSASGDHDLGELLIGVTSRYGELLKKAIKSARSWENQELVSALEAEKQQLDECLKKVSSEAWGMNAMVHFNSWANMEKNAFREVRNAYLNLVQLFKCSGCKTLLHVIPLKGNSETLKCDCNKRNYNLKAKS